MDSCPGNGLCLYQCECYDEETDEYYKTCECGHREHDGYCSSDNPCCVPIECRNYKFCNQKLPQWVLDTNNGMCMNCAIQMGSHTYTNQVEECCVCLQNQIMLILKCKHKICNDCWFVISSENVDDVNKPLCPLCRKCNNWSNKPENV